MNRSVYTQTQPEPTLNELHQQICKQSRQIFNLKLEIFLLKEKSGDNVKADIEEQETNTLPILYNDIKSMRELLREAAWNLNNMLEREETMRAEYEAEINKLQQRISVLELWNSLTQNCGQDDDDDDNDDVVVNGEIDQKTDDEIISSQDSSKNKKLPRFCICKIFVRGMMHLVNWFLSLQKQKPKTTVEETNEEDDCTFEALI